MEDAIKKAITAAGSQSKLALALGVSKQAVNQWELGHSRVSSKNAIKIEHIYGIPRAELRPDIYG